MRLPNALVAGQYLALTDLLMMIDGRRRLWSSGVNVRPSTTGTRMASKYPGVVRRTLKLGGSSSPAGGNSSITAAKPSSSPVSGSASMAPARMAPGTASSRSMSRS